MTRQILLNSPSIIFRSEAFGGFKAVMYAPMDGESDFNGCYAGVRKHLQRSRILFAATRIWDPGFETRSGYQ